MTKKDLKSKYIDLIKKEKEHNFKYNKYSKKIFCFGGSSKSSYLHTVKKKIYTAQEMGLIKRYSPADYAFFKLSLQEREEALSVYSGYHMRDYEHQNAFSQSKANIFMACLRQDETTIESIHDLESSKEQADYMNVVGTYVRHTIGQAKVNKIFIVKNDSFKLFDNFYEFYSTIQQLSPSNISHMHYMHVDSDTVLLYDKPLVKAKKVVNFSNNMMKNVSIVDFLSKNDKKFKDMPDIIINHKLF